jgi:hypothetical protein
VSLRRRICASQPSPEKPASIIAQVEGSGTAVNAGSRMKPCATELASTYHPVITPLTLTAVGIVSEEPGTSNAVKSPWGERTKPSCAKRSAVRKLPTIAPDAVMPTGTVSTLPGTSNVMIVPSGVRKNPSGKKW